MAEPTKGAACPHCGNQRIREKNTAYAEILVEDWELSDDETKIVAPSMYDMDIETDWDTVDGPAYVCATCGWTGDATELLVVDAETGKEEGNG